MIRSTGVDWRVLWAAHTKGILLMEFDAVMGRSFWKMELVIKGNGRTTIKMVKVSSIP
jgi:hypothetical protein